MLQSQNDRVSKLSLALSLIYLSNLFKFESFTQVDITKNPLQCTCGLYDVLKQLHVAMGTRGVVVGRCHGDKNDMDVNMLLNQMTTRGVKQLLCPDE